MKARKSIPSKATKRRAQSAKVIQLNIFQQPQQRNVQKLINCVWAAAVNSLWFHKNFSDSEIESFKSLIAEHFYTAKNTKQNFKELIERICLAKRYVERKRGRYISKPQDYLNIHYPLGLAGTSAWLEQVNIIRKDVPEYNKGINTLAKGLLLFVENPSPGNFHKGRKSLIEQNQFDLLQLFNHIIIHLQYDL